VCVFHLGPSFSMLGLFRNALPPLLFLVLLVGQGCVLLCPRDPVTPPQRVNNYSPDYPVGEDDVEFFMNFTAFKDGERIFQDGIGPKAEAMIAAAQRTIILSVFLLDNFYAVGDVGRDIVTPLVDALVAKRKANPDMRIAIILDPSNKAYAQRLSPAEKRFRENGIDVFYSDLIGGLRKASLLGVAEGLGHIDRTVDWLTFRLWGSLRSWVFTKARLPARFDGEPVSLETAYNASLIKANHRKLLVTDRPDGSLEALIATANPHNASAFHINSAVSVRGAPAQFVYSLLREDLLKSAKLGPLYAHWNYEADRDYRKSYGEDCFPKLPMCISDTRGEGPRIRIITEREILKTVLENLGRVELGDEVRIQMFYLSYRPVVKAIIDAAVRSKRPVRLLLDANNDSFNKVKDGTPNRQAARFLLREAKERGCRIEIRWYATHGEQNHAKTMSITNPAKGKYLLTTGSGNWTGRNLTGVNMESNVLVDGSEKINRTFNDLFDLFWTNRDGRLYSLDYGAFGDKTASDFKWRIGEKPFFFSTF
jgi:hypothetical protein